MKDEAGLGLSILSVQQAIISSYEDNCPLKLAKTGNLLSGHRSYSPLEEE